MLLAEDEPISRELVTCLLEAAGLQVDTALDGLAVVAQAARQPPDLILMDMQMAQLDGLEATRRIRRTASGAGVPIVALTVNAFSQDQAQCLAAGMDDFVAKPVDPEVLFSVVLRWLAQSRAS